MGFFKKSSQPPTKDQFGQMFLAGIQRAGEKRTLVYDPKQSCVLVVDEPGRRMYVDNIYAEYCSVPPEARPVTMQRYVRSWSDALKPIPDEYADASHDLLPVIRSRAYYAAAALAVQLDGRPLAEIPQQLLGEDLSIGLVYDFRDAMRTIGGEDLIAGASRSTKP